MRREVDYVAFALGRGMLDGFLPYEDDYAYDKCCELAEDFMKSEYNNPDRDLYSCLQEYALSVNEYADVKWMKNGTLLCEFKSECQSIACGEGSGKYCRILRDEIRGRMDKRYD